jgi:hypothetical protein
MTPNRRAFVIFSSLVKKCAAITANNGVVAFRIDTRLEVMWLCPQTRRLIGTMLFRKPIHASARNVARSNGILRRSAPITAIRISAAMPRRQATMVKVGSSVTAIA